MSEYGHTEVDDVVRSEQDDEGDEVADLGPVQDVQEALVQPLEADQGRWDFFTWKKGAK